MLRTTMLSLVLLLALLPVGMIEKTGASHPDSTRALVRGSQPLQAAETTPEQAQREQSKAGNRSDKLFTTQQVSSGTVVTALRGSILPVKLIPLSSTDTQDTRQKQPDGQSPASQEQEMGGSVAIPSVIEGVRRWPPVEREFPTTSSLLKQQQPLLEIAEREPNDTPETAQVVTPPVTINGRAAPGEPCAGGSCWCFDANDNGRCDRDEDRIEDWYRFTVTQLTTIMVTLVAPNPTRVDFDVALSPFIPGANRLPALAGSFQRGTPPESYTITLEPGTYVIPLSNNEFSPTGTAPSTYTLVIEAFPISLDIGVTSFDPNPRLLNDDKSTVTIKSGDDDLTGIDRNLRPVKDVVADGVTKLLLRVQTEANQVTLCLRDAGGGCLSSNANADGTLSTLENQSTGSTTITVPTRVVNDTGPFAFAIYNAPLDFSNDPNDTRQTRDVTITVSAGGPPVHYTITLHRPPVVLVHGYLGSPKTWQTFEGVLNRSGFHAEAVAYPSTESFDPERFFLANKTVPALHDKILRVLNNVRARGIAASRVDVVAHSMGGLVARSLVQFQQGKLYTETGNFRRGYFHKLITVATPHFGTQLANSLDGLKDCTVTLAGGTAVLVGTLIDLGVFVFAPATSDLKVGSAAIRHINETSVPSMTIVGIKPPTSNAEGVFRRFLGTFLIQSLDAIFFTDQHDLVVQARSQAGGSPLSPLNVVPNVVHTTLFDPLQIALAEPESPGVHERLLQLLYAPVSSFAPSLPPPSTISEPPIEIGLACKLLLPSELGKAQVQVPGIMFTSPSNGTFVRPGETVRLTATVINNVPIQNVVFFAQGFGLLPQGASPFEAQFTAPTNLLGPQTMVVLASDAQGRLYGDVLTLIIQPQARLLSLSVQPQTVVLPHIAARVQLEVVGNFDDGIQRPLTTASTGTTYQIQRNGAVITIGPDGLITAVANGRDVVTITNSGLRITVPVEVQATNAPPLLLPIDDIALAPGTAVEIPILVTQSDCDAVTLSARDLPPFGMFTDNGDGTGSLRLIPMAGDVGEYSDALITVLDDGTPPLGDSERINITVSGEAANTPVITTARAALQGGVLVLTLSGRDANADVTKLGVRRFDSMGAEIAEQQFDIPSVTGQGRFDLTFRVTDGQRLTDTAFLQLRLIDAAGNRSVGFNVKVNGAGDTQPPFVVLHEPNGEQTLLPGSRVTIRWDACDNTGVISQDIQLSVDGGETYRPIGTVSGTARSFDWDVPRSLATEQGRIRIIARDQAGNMAQDESDADFRVPDTARPAVTMITPNGGEAFRPGRLTIRWTSSDNVGVVSQDIFLSTDGGTSFPTRLASGLPGDVQAFEWDIPTALNTPQARLRIIVRDAAGNFNQDETDATFIVDPIPPTVGVSTPNGGEFLRAGRFTIRWTASDNVAIASQDILLSVDGGASFQTQIAANLPGDVRSFPWDVPSTLVTTQARIRVVARDTAGNMAQDDSNTSFTVDPVAPAVTVVTPNGGETVTAGRTFTVRWTSSDNIRLASHTVQLSTNGGQSFTNLAQNLPATAQSFDWSVPAELATNQARIRVVAADAAGNTAADASDANFTVPDSARPNVTVRSPNGGELVKAGRLTIRWSSSDNVGVTSHDVLLSTDGGATFPLTLASALPGNSQSFDWEIPASLVSTQARIRIIARDAAGNTGQDDSNSNFTVDPIPPSVTVTSPNGGESISAGSTITIRWNSADNLGLSRHSVFFSSDGGRSYIVLSQGQLGGDVRSFEWRVPSNLVTTQARIRVSAFDTVGNTTQDESDTNFSIVDTTAPAVTVRSPNGGELIGAGIFSIQWSTSDNIGVVSQDILLSTDGGTSYPTVIASNLAGQVSSLNWTVPGMLATTQARIRVIARDAAGNIGQDDSNANFTIDSIPPSVRVESPNGGESISADTTISIRWTSSDNLGLSRHSVLFSSDGGRSFTTVAQGLGADTRSFDWRVPVNLATTQGRIRLIAFDMAGNATQDESDANFTITGVPDINLLRSNLDFGSVPLGTSQDLSLAIQNLGGATLTISNIASTSGTPEFSYVSPTVPFTIAPGQSVDIILRFSPASLGSRRAVFTITSNDPDEGTASFTVSGTGVTLLGRRISGSLSPSDGRSVARGNSYFADRYTLMGSAGQQIAISMVSSDFDTYLYLLRADNMVLASDNDGGGGRNSRIPAGSGFFTLPATGTYIIEATSFLANATGNYSLVVTDTNTPVTVFNDDMEGGTGEWIPTGTWAQTTAASHSPTHSWTDSPAGNYANNTTVSLISPVIDLTGLKSVTLTFWHRYEFESGFDFGRVLVTTDNGRTFSQLLSFTGTLSSWSQVSVDLSTFAGSSSIRIYFQVISDSSITRDGWYIDDVVITGRN
jgi:pimeloyl-ACP methyl ester carboxylesterase